MRFPRLFSAVLAAALFAAWPARAQGGLWGDDATDPGADGLPEDINVPAEALPGTDSGGASDGGGLDGGLDTDFVIPGEDGQGVGAAEAPGSFGWAVQQYREANYRAACEAWLALAGQGHAASQHNVAVCLDHGRGLAPDARQAAGWYWQAVEHDLPEAMNNLAKLHTDGRGVQRDHHLAANLYARAADLGLADAQYNLAASYYRGLGVAKDMEHALHWMTLAAEAGHVRAQYDLGGFLLAGVGTAPDAEGAAHWYAAAAEQGDAAATYALGFLHYRGDGVEKDLARALDLIERAATAGVVPAQNQAGVMRAKGEGGARDPIAAYRWFTIAYGLGDAAAGRNRARLEPHLDAEQIAEARAQADAFRPEPIAPELPPEAS